MGASEPSGNLWQASAPPPPETAPLDETATVDLAIIGGGFTGCSAALHAAEQGASVRLLEAHQIGHGGSGRNAGLANAGLWTPPAEIEALLGQAAGGRLNQALGGAPDLVFGLIERHGIACAPRRAGTLHCAHAASGLRDLDDRFRQLRARGAPVELLDAAETARRTGSKRFHGALFDRRAGTIQPLAYCLGLARAAQAAGAVLHEESPATTIGHDGENWLIRTDRGALSAGALLMATNGYHQPIEGAPAPAYVPMHYFQMATRPLSDNLRKSILPGGEGCWDTALVMSSFRLDAAGRLIVGGVGSLSGLGAATHRAWARRKMAALFDDAVAAEFEHAWFGRIAMTSDHTPKVLRLGPRGLSVFGYSGRGIGPGTLFGKAAAEALLSGEESDLPLAPIEHYGERWTGLRSAYFEFGAWATHWLGPRS